MSSETAVMPFVAVVETRRTSPVSQAITSVLEPGRMRQVPDSMSVNANLFVGNRLLRGLKFSRSWCSRVCEVTRR